MLLTFQKNIKFHIHKNKSERVYLNKAIDLNTAALPNMIIKFFIKNMVPF